ncbi:hypothetical protein BB558_000287 [Smittium angustum]|uniref:Small EDRK-rich factor-like N-terminal domain-containing protein n=1 Tax=Smittium angustum TaxID=133377 RepID=A0A2U1JEL1_SMIAN|nr:hypothetical protein BB558_000287 [Smittium angustum]
MTRGNQRELAREKARKKAEKHGKSKKEEGELNLQSKKERDAEIMRQKQLKKQQEKEAAEGSNEKK